MFIGEDNVLHCECANARRNVNMRNIFLYESNDDAAISQGVEETTFLSSMVESYSAETLLVKAEI